MFEFVKEGSRYQNIDTNMKIVENKRLKHSEPHNHSEKKLFFLNETLSDIP